MVYPCKNQQQTMKKGVVIMFQLGLFKFPQLYSKYHRYPFATNETAKNHPILFTQFPHPIMQHPPLSKAFSLPCFLNTTMISMSSIQLITFMSQTRLQGHSYLLVLSLLMLVVPAISSKCQSYDDFLTGCGRSNDINGSEQYATRKARYETICKENQEINAQNGPYTLDVQCVSSDLFPEEYEEKLGLKPIKTNANKQTSYGGATPGKVSAVTIPTSYNYVTLGHVTSIKNQGSCGCCWSFASIAMYESVLLMRGHSYGLSQQASLECTSNYSPNKRVSDCSGGYFEDPLTFLATVGGLLRSNYPYISGSYGSGAGYPTTPGICAQSSRISIGNGTSAIYGPLTTTQIKTLLIDEGPVMVGVYANTGFTQYSSGVYSGCPSNSANFINHAVTLVGYDDSTSSWLIKNQWGSDWGESGYIRLSYTFDCGLKSLLGNIKFTSYNANPSVTVSSSLLFSNGNWQSHASLALLAVLFLMSMIWM